MGWVAILSLGFGFSRITRRDLDGADGDVRERESGVCVYVLWMSKRMMV